MSSSIVGNLIFYLKKKVWQFKNILRRIIIGSDRWEGKFNAFPRQPVKYDTQGHRTHKKGQ